MTYQVLGHLKTCLVLAFGYLVLENPFSWKNMLGILVSTTPEPCMAWRRTAIPNAMPCCFSRKNLLRILVRTGTLKGQRISGDLTATLCYPGPICSKELAWASTDKLQLVPLS